MAELLSEVEYGRILGSFTAVAEDFGDTVAPDAIPLAGKVVFSPSISHVTYINSDGETASLYLHPVTASIVDGRLIGSEGNDGVVLLASNSNNVSASVLWTASIYIDPIGPGQEAPEVYRFLIEVSRNEISSLIDVIKANSRVHNVALFHDAIAEAAAKFWERVEAGEFRGNQGPPGPAGVGVGVPGPEGRPGVIGKDGDPGVGGNLLPDGDLEEPGFFISGDYLESDDAVSGVKAVRLSNATSRKIKIEPETSYVGTAYFKSDSVSLVKVSLRVFGLEGDISRVIENTYELPSDSWRRVTFLLDSDIGDQSMEIIVTSDGRTISADLFTLSDNSVVQGLQRDLTAAQAQLEAAMARLDQDLEEVDAERKRLGESLNDLAAVLEDGNVDLTELNEEIADLKNDLAAEETKRQEADAAAQLILDQLDTSLAQAKQDLIDNEVILGNLDTGLKESKAELDKVSGNITKLETITLPALEQTLSDADKAATQALATLDEKLYGATGDITTAKANIDQLATDLDIEEQARLQLAQDISEDFTERDARLNAAEDTLATAFPDGAVNVSAELDRTIRDYVVEYAVSSSATIAPTTGWSVTSPTRSPGEYIWFRTKVVYGDGVASTSSAALLTGNEGEQGPKGEDGTDGADGTGITILGSFDTEDELPASGSLGDSYLVGGYLFVWTDTGWDNAGLIQGPQGVPGEAGADGQPTYTWVKYADTAEGLGMSDDPSGKRYIGLAFNKDVQTESTTATDYQWALFEGPEGPEGVKGDPGDQGEQGVGVESITPFFRDVVSGSSAPASPTVWDPTGWTTAEPAWAPNRDLYRTERIRYTNDTFVYTPATKIAAYAGIDAAMEAANGKNLNTYTDLAIASKPGPAPAPDNSRTVGDIHRNRDKSTGEIWAEYQWTGTAWQEVSFGDGVLSSLDVGKVTGGTGAFQKFFADNLIADNATINKLWTDQLVGKTAAFNQIAVASGNILVDPQGLDPSIRTNVGGASWAWDDEGRYWTRPAVQGGTTQFNAYTNVGSVYDSNLLDPGAMYVISYEVWVDKVGPDTAARAAIYYRNRDGSTSFVGDATEEGGDTDHWQEGVTAGQWNKVTRHWRAPDDVLSGGINFQLLYGADDATEVRIRNPFVGKQAPAVLIEDGAISAEKVNAESVAGAVGSFIELETSQLIATDSIKTPEAVIDKLFAETFAVHSITADKLMVGGSQNLIPGVRPGSNRGLSQFVWDEAEEALTPSFTGRGTAYADESFFIGPGEYVVEADIKASVEGTRTYIGLLGLTPAWNYRYGISNVLVGTEWQHFSATLTIPEGDEGEVRARFLPSYSGDETATTWYRNITIRPMVGSVLIEDGAINASKINAESVGAAVGEFVKLDVKNLTAGSANINSLVAQKIAAGTAAFQTVNADKIIASTGTMDSATINQIWADGIAAKSITTSKLTVATGNLVPDGDEMVTDSQWGNMVRSTTDKPGQTIASRTQAAGTGGGASIGNEAFPVTPGQEYSVQMWIKASKPNSRFFMELRDATTGEHAGTGKLIEPEAKGTGRYVLFNNQIVPDVWTLFRGTWVPDPGVSSVRFGTFYFNHSNGTERNADISIAGLSIKPKVGAVLIEDGAISANHMTANSIDTEHLRANAVSAEKIVAGAVTTEKMTANSIDGDRIRANTLDAGKISANSITATQIKARAISADEIATRTILAENIVSGTITANEIKAKTITAAEIKAGAIEAEHLNVSGEFIGNMISGQHIYGTIVEGGEIRTTAESGGQVILSDNGFVSSYNGAVAPGLMLIPADTSQTANPPGIGPFEGGVAVDGGRSADGGYSFLRTKPEGTLLYARDANNSRGEIQTLPGISLMTSSQGSSESRLQARPTEMFIRNTAGDGTQGETLVRSDRATLTTRDPAGATMSTIGAQGRGAWMRAYAVNGDTASGNMSQDQANLWVRTATGATKSILCADNRAAYMRANATDGTHGIASATPALAHLSTYGSDGATRSTLRADGRTVWMRANATNGDSGFVQASPTYSLIKSESGTGNREVATNTEKAYLKATATSGNYSMIESAHDGARMTRVDASSNVRTCAFEVYGGEARMWGTDGQHMYGRVFANSGGVEIRSGYGDAYIRLRQDGAGDQFACNAIYSRTSSAAANVSVTSYGTLRRMTSSRRYKKNIANWSPDPKAVLALQPRQWQDRQDVTEIDETWHVGFIAEEVDDLGLKKLVQYVGDGKGGWIPESLNYDRFAAAQQVVLQKHEDEIKELRAEINELRSRM